MACPGETPQQTTRKRNCCCEKGHTCARGREALLAAAVKKRQPSSDALRLLLLLARSDLVAAAVRLIVPYRVMRRPRPAPVAAVLHTNTGYRAALLLQFGAAVQGKLHCSPLPNMHPLGAEPPRLLQHCSNRRDPCAAAVVAVAAGCVATRSRRSVSRCGSAEVRCHRR